MSTCDVFVVESEDDEIIVAHVLLRDVPMRVRPVLTATIQRNDPQRRRLIGAFNRFLHWHEILHYRQEGIRYYDFGGVELRTDSPLYSITRFKQSFGGSVIRENTLRLSDNVALRLMLRGASRMKDAWARWPA